MTEQSQNRNGSNNVHITVILDRSGSMEDIRKDVIGGFNRFLDEQKSIPGQKVTMTFVQFDGQDPFEAICRYAPIEEVVHLDEGTFVPRGSTPLLDAIGQGVRALDGDILNQEESERPGKVIFTIITDGQENSSVEYEKAQVVDLIDKKTKAGWEFVFLTADLSAFSDAREYGLREGSSMHFMKSSECVKNAFVAYSKNVRRYRSGEADDYSFDAEDRKKAGSGEGPEEGSK